MIKRPISGSLLISTAALEQWGPSIRELVGDVDVVTVDSDGTHGDLSTVEIAFFSGDCYPELAGDFMMAVLGAEELQWIHAFHAGLDNPVYGHLLSNKIRVSNSSGANAEAVAQGAITGLLALARDFPATVIDQQNHHWNRRTLGDLSGCQLAVLGMGPIGCNIARVALALGMRVTGVRRTVTGEEPCTTLSLDNLPDLLSISDYVVLALPLTPSTRGILDADALAGLKPGCRVINVGRGELIDEDALIDSLRSGQVGGAALDVFHTEPLPEESPLWDLPTVIITPHIAGLTIASHERAANMFLENLSLYAEGQELNNEAKRAIDNKDENQ